ncbi:hypothetical protein SAMN06265827_105116 [Orenia metallireducens]|uniref:Uncharacterized protein n=1 Tax=Orenia metallireducens TaxID=1413210 RepID=A0A285G7S1_9FIRM|nr:hypothetical protein [Orenia metallireducens]SNY19413.1 hypothetical protein SAMN06265827_105116 [Orenia metallireducens]
MITIEKIQNKAKEVIKEVEVVVDAEYPKIENSLDFVNKYKGLISALESHIAYKLNILQLSEEQSNYIWRQFNIELNKFYEKLSKKSTLKSHQFVAREHKTNKLIGAVETFIAKEGISIEVEGVDYLMAKVDKEKHVLYLTEMV